jgi:hypothetical protein
MQCEVVATSNTVAAVAMPASTKNLRSKTLGFVSFAGAKDTAGWDWGVITVWVSNTLEAGASCPAAAKLVTRIRTTRIRTISERRINNQPPGLKIWSGANLAKVAKQAETLSSAQGGKSFKLSIYRRGQDVDVGRELEGANWEREGIYFLMFML